MMNNYKYYEIEVEVLTPVFVGNGEEITKKEYAYNPDTKNIYVIDHEKLFKVLNKKNILKSYETFLMDYSQKNLWDWLKKHALEIEINEITKYKLDNEDIRIQGRETGIKLFMKDPYGNPYIPGTSLKGLIRNALIGKYLIDNPKIDQELYVKKKISDIKNINKLEKVFSSDIREEDKRITEFLNRNSGEMKQKERELIEGKKQKDIFYHFTQNILVSDSTSLKHSDLILAKKVDMNYNGKTHEINIYREAVSPGTKFTFTLSIPENIPYTKTKFDFDINYIFGALDEKNSYDLDYVEPVESDGAVFRIGGGVGFHNKTVISSALEEENAYSLTKQILQKKNPVKKHLNDDESPRVVKMTYSKNEIVQMGICSAKYQEIKL